MQTTVTIHLDGGAKANQRHNRRDPSLTRKEAHIDPNGIHENWIDRDLKKTCEKLFGESIREFNERQKKNPSRMKTIESYIAECNKGVTDKQGHVRQSKLVHEAIIYVGDKDGEVPAELRKEIMARFFKFVSGNMPGVKVIGAYYHQDERFKDPVTKEWRKSAPHLHLDFIMTSKDNKRGLRVQSSSKGCLKQMGFDTFKKDGKIYYKKFPELQCVGGKDQYQEVDGKKVLTGCNPMSLFTQCLRNELAREAKIVCKEHGIDLEITHTREGKKWTGKEIYQLEQDMKRLQKENEWLNTTAESLTQANKALEANKKTLEDENRNLGQIRAELEQNNLDLQNQIREQRKEQERQKQKIRAQEQTIQDQGRTIKTQKKQIQIMTKAIQKLKSEYTKVKSELDQLKSFVKKVRDKVHELKESFREYKTPLQALKALIQSGYETLTGYRVPDMSLKDAINNIERNDRPVEAILHDIEELEDEYNR